MDGKAMGIDRTGQDRTEREGSDCVVRRGFWPTMRFDQVMFCAGRVFVQKDLVVLCCK